MQRRHIAAAMVLPAVLACSHTIRERAPSEDAAIRQAGEKAQATLDGFLARAKQPAAGTSSYAVKVGMQQGLDTEYFWVNEFTWTDGSFTGRINNEPRLLKSVKPGQVYNFNRSQIVDWTYVDDRSGKTFGNFTACALLSQEPPAQAEAIKRRDGLVDCP